MAPPANLFPATLSPFHILSLISNLQATTAASISTVYVTSSSLNIKLSLNTPYSFPSSTSPTDEPETSRSVWLVCTTKYVTLCRVLDKEQTVENKEGTNKLRSALKSGRIIRVQQGEINPDASSDALPTLSRTILIPILTPSTTLRLLLQLHSSPNIILLSSANQCLWCLHTTSFIAPNMIPSLKTTNPLTSTEAFIQSIRANPDLPHTLTLRQILQRNDCPLAPAGDAFVDHVLHCFQTHAGEEYDGVMVEGLDGVVADQVRESEPASAEPAKYVSPHISPHSCPVRACIWLFVHTCV